MKIHVGNHVMEYKQTLHIKNVVILTSVCMHDPFLHIFTVEMPVNYPNNFNTKFVVLMHTYICKYSMIFGAAFLEVLVCPAISYM